MIKLKNWFFIYGCMFSGKSSKLIALTKHCKQSHIELIHSNDKERNINGNIVTHDGIILESFSSNNFNDIAMIINEKAIEAIFIDEIQFFDIELLNGLFDLNILIYFCGLDMDYKGEYFPISKKLLELVPKKNKLHLKAICDCGKFAVRTVLKSKKNYSTNILIYNINTINHNTNIIVGGEDLYKPTCKKCFINYKPHD